MSKFKTNFLMVALAVLTILVPQASFATTAGFGIGDTVCKVFNCIVNSSLTTMIATVAIFFLGIGAFFGKVNWGLVIIISIGIVVLLGALNIAESITSAKCDSGLGFTVTCT